ncbi:MAG TPA: hypothetical protein VN908_03510 [Gemmatimonadales bacterium]|nr:hypothetical protein [Gemmatimonadales bacterium]
MHVSHGRLLAAFVIAVTTAAVTPLRAQDTTGRDTIVRKDTVPVPSPLLPALPPSPVPAPVTPPAPQAPPAPPAPPAPTLEQIRYVEGLRTATRGVAQLRDGLSRVTRTQQASDSLRRRGAARRLGGLCATARTFIASGRPKMQSTAYADSLRTVAKQLVMRLDSLASALPACEQTAGRQPAVVAADLTNRLRAYDEALLAFRNGLAAQNKPDSTKTVSQQ